MRVLFKITSSLLERARQDLARRHKFALERVGFFSWRAAKLNPKGVILLANEYHEGTIRELRQQRENQ